MISYSSPIISLIYKFGSPIAVQLQSQLYLRGLNLLPLFYPLTRAKKV